MKIVLDTNVLIAALIASGVCSDLLEHCVRRHALITSDFILSELREHLIHKFKLSLQDTEEAVSLLQSRMEVVVPSDLGVAVCRDLDDDTVLGTAIAGDATCVVTGDKDLLVIKRFRDVDIVSPSEFAQYEAHSQDAEAA